MNDTNYDGNIIGGDETGVIPVDDDTDVTAMNEEGSDNDEASVAGNLLELLSRMHGMMPDSDDDDDDEDDDMDADDFHNKAVDRARRGKNREAAEICMKGLKKHPFSVDLLADTIMYSSKAGDMATAAKHYAMLKGNVPYQRWNWRAFTFSFDYLLKEDPSANEKECRDIIANYKKFLAYEEKACMAESELEAALGNADTSMHVLEEAIRNHSNASQCALRLADMQMDRGLYEEVLNTTNYGIAASAEAQPSINIPYLYFIRALAKDHILHKKECGGEPITTEEVDALREEYGLLLSEFPELRRHAHIIQTRVKMLKFVKTR